MFFNNDIPQFFKTLTTAKSANALRVLRTYYWSRLTNSPHHSGLPFTLSIEPTTSCNLRCPECPSGLRSFSRPTGMLSPTLFEKILEETQEHLLFLYFYFQGEPYLHPQFTELVHRASQKNIYTVTSTNAHYLEDEQARKTVESGLSRLIVSIDGTTQNSYAAYRVGGNLQKALDGAKNISNWKQKLKSKSPRVIFQMVVFRHNESEIQRFYQMAKEAGAEEAQLKTAQIYDFEKGSSLIPENEKYARYALQGNGFYSIKNALMNHCWKMWHSCVVTWDGKVVPCCFDKDATHVMGDLQKQSLKEVWNGNRYREFRASLLRSRKEIDICSNCSEGTKVWV